MKTGTSLSGQSLLQSLRDKFKRFPDHRDPTRIEIAIEDFLMSGLAVFQMKFPSLLKFEEEMKSVKNLSNLTSMFGVSRVPSDTHARSLIDEIGVENFRPLFNDLFSKAQRAKVLERFRVFDSHYLLAVDGTGYFFSDSVHCESCIEKKHKTTGESTYHHQMLCGAIVHPEKNTVIPMCPEGVLKQDGDTKNDCEQNAMKRFLLKFREDHPKLKTILLTDALHSTLPRLEDLKALDMGFILAVKPGSHTKLFEGVDKWDERGQVRHFTVEEEIGDKVKKKRIHHYRYTNGILLNHQSVHMTVNFLEYWETTQWVSPKGELKEEKRHFSWVTDFSLYESSCQQIMRAGRTRWKIENETFNTLKNQGYEFEHNFGHGYKNLSTNFANLMMLAFMVDQLQELGCELFQAALRARFNKRSRLWEMFKAIYTFLPTIESYHQFLDMIAHPESWKVVPNSS